MTNPLDMPVGRQNRAAKKANLTLAEWRKQQQAAQAKPADAPDMAFNTAGPDSAVEDLADD
jgi:hypothetical protein